ncbi:erythroblast NAD(P)(+)--arginine ADP-ribosyltransferase-like [Oenanthe melanoleuca]|uniref:erythroblast NAD(P)(+)--arginine ADP-ribosyltransferase-like n=1 Tax=Oenanthe melanoleuca TaxID=2939378 RepID=UPI0024C2056F|nr:erythroblast NAD(P)(+)--arginine ADP-ribosyltransferase-like [Oenanthe melanoleuca]
MALLALTLALLAMTVATTAITVIPLDMALNSFDDQYQDCGPAMKAELPALNRSEFQKNSLFAKVWPMAVGMRKFGRYPQYPLSSSAHAIAIMAYTMIYLHKEFNDAVRVAGRSPQEYRDSFHFKTLHFLLTDALATLRDFQGRQCYCVFRGVDQYKFEANVGDTVRFGQFASSTLCENVIHDFGTTTVFKVITCHGAYIRNFSLYPGEEEVLIPPFEKFKVSKIIEGTQNVQIHLDSFGTYSRYNCEWLKGKSIPRAPATSEDSSGPPQFRQRALGSSGPQSHQGHEDPCSHCGNHDHQDHQDSQRNKATKTTKATTTTMAALATMASVWSLRSPLAL